MVLYPQWSYCFLVHSHIASFNSVYTYIQFQVTIQIYILYNEYNANFNWKLFFIYETCNKIEVYMIIKDKQNVYFIVLKSTKKY